MFPQLSSPSSQFNPSNTLSSSLPCDPWTSEPQPSQPATDFFSAHAAFSTQISSALQPPQASGWSAPTASFTSTFGFSDAPGFSARVTVNSYASPSASRSTSFFSDNFNASANVPPVSQPTQPQSANNLVQLAAVLQMLNQPGSNSINSEPEMPRLPAPLAQFQSPSHSSQSTHDALLLRFLEATLSNGKVPAPPTNTMTYPALPQSTSHNNIFSNALNRDVLLPLQPFSSFQAAPMPSFPLPPAAAPVPANPASTDYSHQLSMLLELFASAKAKSQAPVLSSYSCGEVSTLAAPTPQSSNGYSTGSVAIAGDTRQAVSSVSNLSQAAWDEFSVAVTKHRPAPSSQPQAAMHVKAEPVDCPSSPALSDSSANQWEVPRSRDVNKPKPRTALTKRVKHERGGHDDEPKLKKKMKTRRSRLHVSDRDLDFQSEIVCGTIDVPTNDFTVNNVHETHIFEPFFGRTVEVFTAVKDPARRRLFQTTELTKSLACSNNMLAMYLARRKRLVNSGIYQATSILYKRNCRKDVKCSGYFITLEACKKFAHYFQQRKVAAQVKVEEDRLISELDQDESNDGAQPFLEASPADSIHSASTASTVVGDDRLTLPASVGGNSA